MTTPAATERGYIIRQHVGWLKTYVAEMTPENWRDMRLRCERQLGELSGALDAANPMTADATLREALMDAAKHGDKPLDLSLLERAAVHIGRLETENKELRADNLRLVNDLEAEGVRIEALQRTAGRLETQVKGDWRKDCYGNERAALYLGKLFAGSIMQFNNSNRRGWFMFDDEGSSTGWYATDDEARKSVEAALDDPETIATEREEIAKLIDEAAIKDGGWDVRYRDCPAWPEAFDDLKYAAADAIIAALPSLGYAKREDVRKECADLADEIAADSGVAGASAQIVANRIRSLATVERNAPA
ncbi:MAG: hypothetical protein A3E01_02945 [Gammaproteobacteria bacterium RIFCSPHIGHO2_12_FULL_63_22]|nr:MAG: hypothetical protein A3E01_02945 [Gammaproteobacteria bacterium RIFCSPHIGHO2_12_FULL_63_22]